MFIFVSGLVLKRFVSFALVPEVFMTDTCAVEKIEVENIDNRFSGSVVNGSVADGA